MSTTKKENLENSLIQKEETPIALNSENQSYVTKILENLHRSFVEANPDLDMDFVYMTKWLSIDSKGNFVEKSGDDIVKNFKDSIDGIIVKGEQKYSLWGKEGSAEDGSLIVAEDTLEKAQEMLSMWLERNPQAIERYNLDSIESRYIAYIIPCENLKDDLPKIYTLGLSPTSKITYGQWAYDVFGGAFKAKGIPKNTGVSQVVTRLSTVSKVNKQKQNYTGVQFEAIEMFRPEKFNLK